MGGRDASLTRAGGHLLAEQTRDDFAARAERERRAGNSRAALEIAQAGLAAEPRHTAGRVAAGLALLDLGLVAEARRELEQVVRVPELAVAAPLSDLAEAELDLAFEAAAPEQESMLDAEGIAMQAVTAVEDHAGPELPGEAFRTQSMARLLEQQGDAVGAEAIRRSLREDIEAEADVFAAAQERAEPEGPAAPEAEAPPRAKRPRRRTRVEVLERWLHNVRRGQG